MDEASDSESINCGHIARQRCEEESQLHCDDESEECVHLKHHLYQSVGWMAERCSIVAIRRMIQRSSAMGRAQLEAFKLYEKAVAEKNDGDPNMKLGWYSSSIEGVRQIRNNGFGAGGIPSGTFGFGLCIHGDFSAANCILSSVADANGLRHIILCRVILGNVEVVLPGSKQYGPSSDQFHSGVDNLRSPQKYIVWYSDAKTHVLPLYELVIKLDIQSKGMTKKFVERPRTPWISFKLLISTLSKCSSSSKICLIKKLHIKYMERKISRMQLVAYLRRMVGDELLVSIIKSFQGKVYGFEMDIYIASYLNLELYASKVEEKPQTHMTLVG